MNKLLSLLIALLCLSSCEPEILLPSTKSSTIGHFNNIHFNTAVELMPSDPYKSIEETIYVDGELDKLQIHVINPELKLGIALTDLEATEGSNGIAFLNIQEQWQSHPVFIKILEEGTPSYYDFEYEGYRFGENYTFSVQLIPSDSRIENEFLIIEAPYFP